MRTKLYILLLLGCTITQEMFKKYGVNAITEDENEISLKDLTKEKQRISAYDLSEEEKKIIEEKKEAFTFNADVSRLMDIIINSLYTKKEVFLRELISNASDALDKLRFISIQNPEQLGEFHDLEVRIDYDQDAKTLSITDTGVGMTKAELIKNLGTVAKSGTTAFLEAMGKGDQMSLIGQFGVGFYSAFLVANKVEVTSKSNDDEQHIWTSTADAKFFVTKDPRGDTLGRGTRVTLYLKDDASEYIEQDKIKNLIKKYSEFINYPIKLYVSKQVSEEIEDNEEKTLDETETPETQVEDEEEGSKKEKKTKTITKTVWDWDLVNDIKAIWMRDKSEITDREYDDFYKTISKDTQDPLAFSHFSAEGEIDFKSIIYIPKEAPYEMFENYYGKSSALKLYVRRVLITEEFDELMPRYLNFIKGVVDSDDLPLNVSREQLQQMKMIKVMSKKLVKKALEMIKALADEQDEEDEEEEGKEGDETKKEDVDKYDQFWKNFGKNIKLGVIEDATNRNKLAKLLRFTSTHDPQELTSLDDYISRMKEDQDTILYLPGDSQDSILKSPILKKYIKMGYEVLLLTDPIDEFCTQHLTEYEKKKIKSIAKDDVSLIDNNDEVSKKKLKKLKEMYKPLTDWWKKFLGPQVEKVSVSNKLDDDPLFILTSQYGFSATMEKVNKAQALSQQGKAQNYMIAKKTLELNPHHSVMKELLSKVKNADDGKLDSSTEELATVLYNMALLNSGFQIEDPSVFSGPLQRLINVGFGLKRDQQIEEIEIDIQDEEKDKKEDSAPVEEEIKLDFNEEQESAPTDNQYNNHIHDDL